MAIDRGPWNALIDDDGSNLVGTVWNKDKIKTVLLDPTDAAIAAGDAAIIVPTQGAWTPVDASGAGLVYGYAVGRYWRFHSLVMITAQVNYPVTSNGANAKIGGLPVAPAHIAAGLFGLVNAYTFRVLTGATVIEILHGATGVAATNAQISGAGCVFSGVYLSA